MEEQLSNQNLEQNVAQRESKISLEEGIAKLPKGFALFEGIIKELTFLNPEKQAKRNQFLTDDDKKNESMLQRKYNDKGGFAGCSIAVNIYYGTVLLTGQIKTPEQKDMAEDLAKTTVGINRIYNSAGFA